ncbi:MAG TPA: hypothetical protein VN743_05950 [Blastocatellia bacterium]|nr:hypothetical protein [Blastocatellia bacterium]
MHANDRIRRRAVLLITTTSLFNFACGNRILLDERFHDPRLINWSVVDDSDTLEGPSDWRVEQDGWLHQASNVWGRRGDFIGRWYGTYLIAGSADWRDYTISVRAKPSDDDGFGVVFRYQDAEHFYRLLFLQDGMSGGPITRLDKRDGADYTELWSEPKGYRPSSEMLIEIDVDGDVIGATADGKRLCEVKDGSYSRGKIGLFCYAQKGQAFDDVKVTSR